MEMQDSLPLSGPVPLPEGRVEQDDELRALRTALDIAATTVAQRPESAIVRQLHREAAAKYQQACAERGLVIRE